MQSRFWLVLLCLFLVLGINKQLDLHSDLIKALRMYVIHSGLIMYEYPLKLSVVLLGAAVLAFLAKAVKDVFPESVRNYKMIWLGLLMLFFFVFARVVAFDHVFSKDTQFFTEYFSVFFELPALLIILVGTFYKSIS